MQTIDTKGVVPNEEGYQPLPNRPYVSLTEAATWTVEGDCRDDNYLIEQARHLAQQWHCWSGEPSWLLPHLALLRQGQTPEDGDEQKVHDPKKSCRGTLADAQHWLAKTGREPEAAYTEVAAIVARHRELKSAYARFYKLLQDQCSEGRIVLLGIECHKSGLAGKHAPIPSDFFLRPIFHWRGTDEPMLGPSACGASLDAVFARRDTRADYLDVRIKRGDVEKLKQLFSADQDKALTAVTKKDAERKKRIENVLKYALERWPPGAKRPSGHRMASHIEKQKKAEGYSFNAIRKILAGSYPAMKRLGLKGLDR